MISQIYPNKYDNGYKRYSPPVVPAHSQHRGNTYPFPQSQLSLAAIRPAKLNITTMEWQRRDAIIRRMAHECKLTFMDTFYPPTLEDYITYGKCVYVGKPVSYAECDSEEWPLNDSPLLFSAKSLNENGETENFLCNLAFMQKDMPKE